MYYTVKKIIAILIIILMLCACSAHKVDMKLTENEYETDTQIVKIEVPSFKHLGNKELCDEINEKYRKLSDELLNSFITADENASEKKTGKSELKMKQEEKYNKNGVYSLVGEIYEYTDGMYGVSKRCVLNVDTTNSKVIYLKDLFTDDEYSDMLDSKLEKLSKDPIYSDLWEKPKIGDEQNEFFYFDDKGLVIFYPPYELSYYTRGFVELIVPYSELYGYLKPEYSALYKQ